MVKNNVVSRSSRVRNYYKSPLVVVDEIGYTPIDRQECYLIYRFVPNRYEIASTILISNKAFSNWAELFHDQVIVKAILDRLRHHSVVINIPPKGKISKDGVETYGSIG